MFHQLAEVDPKLPHLVIACLVGLTVYLVKNVHPGLWERLPRRWQALPAVLIGALLSGSASDGELIHLIMDSIAGGFDGLLAVGGHHALKRIARKGTGDDL